MTTKPNGNGASMTELVKQQSVIWVRIIITLILIWAGKTFWDLSHNTKSIAISVSSIAERMKTMEQNIGEIKNEVHNNKTNIAVNTNEIKNLAGKHD